MKTWSYLLAPFAAWLAAGCLKFAINSLRAGKPAFGLIGYGGMPSNHSAIVSSMAALTALREGLAFIVMLDAASLRRQVGRHAQALNELRPEEKARLRERMGHTPFEIAGGIAVGCAVAWLLR